MVGGDYTRLKRITSVEEQSFIPEGLRILLGNSVAPVQTNFIIDEEINTNNNDAISNIPKQYEDGGGVSPATAPELTAGRIVVKTGADFDNLDPQLKDIVTEYGNRGVNIRITSGFSQGGHSSNSWHKTGQAIDITPVEGESYEDLLTGIRSQPDLVQRLQESVYKLHNEISSGGEGWTGAHLHIGKDSRVPKDNWQNLTVKDFSQLQQSANENSRIAFDYFISKGYSPIAASGIIGNLMQESGANLQTSALNARENAFGIAQWRLSRRDGLTNFASSTGRSENDLLTQLDYIDHELRTTHKKAFEVLSSANSIEQATDAFNRYYERSADKPGTDGFNKRLFNSDFIYTNYLSGNYTPSNNGSQLEPEVYTAQVSSIPNFNNLRSVVERLNNLPETYRRDLLEAIRMADSSTANVPDEQSFNMLRNWSKTISDSIIALNDSKNQQDIIDADNRLKLMQRQEERKQIMDVINNSDVGLVISEKF